MAEWGQPTSDGTSDEPHPCCWLAQDELRESE